MLSRRDWNHHQAVGQWYEQPIQRSPPDDAEVYWVPQEYPWPVQSLESAEPWTSKWVLETFTDSDWSGDRKSRRSTSSAVHCLNGIPICGQRVVSLSSAEAELHGLGGGAVDGIALRVYLQFLLEEEQVHHARLIDNSAPKQISNKGGSRKLRHCFGSKTKSA